MVFQNTSQSIHTITVCYNAAKTISRTFDSLKCQSRPPNSHTIVDGGSTDGTLDLIRDYKRGASFPVAYVSGKDRGIADAFNKGVQLIEDGWIHFLNADDQLYNETSLARVATHLAATKAGAIVGSIALNRDHQVKIIASKLGERSIYSSIRVCHPAMFVRKSTFNAVGPFAIEFRIAMDTEWILRAEKMLGKDFLEVMSEVVTTMNWGGVSTRFKKNAAREVFAARLINAPYPVWLGFMKYIAAACRS